MEKLDFQYVDYPQWHGERRRQILEKYPEVRKLFGPNQWSALCIFLLVVLQILIGLALKQSPYWLILIASYGVGAFANHALYVQIHECAHNLVFKSSWANKLIGIFCDTVLFLPSSMGFRLYHMLHHKHLGEFDYDADLVSLKEGRMVGNSAWRKALWLSFFFISQGVLRPLRLKKVKFWNKWMVLNLVYVFCVNVALFFLAGPKLLLYLGLSTFFALGLHPLGGRWIQEHYLTKFPQETYSYYGILNKLTFNMGFHNEHHDLMNVPWNRLPVLKKMAPEFYVSLHSYNSWTKVLLNFIFSKKMSPFQRVVHPNTAK